MSDRQGDIAALLFMGAGDEFSAAESYVKEKYFSALKDKWPENVETAEAAAWEIYLILPKYKGTTVTVHELDSDGNAVAELVSTENPVLLKCNVSDITPSAKATIRFKGVETVFIPFISLEDGSVSGGDNVYAEDCAKAAKGVG
jgi:hypothetical protein